MRTLIFLLFIACSWMASAQTKIVGFVKLQSSGNQALPNAEVWAIGAASKPLRFSNTKGYFELEFPSKKAGDVIREVTVTLDGYEVVNKKDLENCALLSRPDDDPLIIVLCKQGEYRKAAADYYETIYHAGEAELQAEKKRLEQALEQERKNRSALEQQLTDINKKLENLPQVAEAAADYFAKIDRDQATQLQKNALAELEKGNIQAALDAMPEEVMDKTMADAQQRKKQLETQLTEVNQVIKQSIENYLFKARLYVSTGDYNAAERLYEKAIAADTTNIENLYDYAVFLEDINRYDKALLWLRKVTTARTDPWFIANAWGAMGQVYEETGDFINAPLAYARFEAIYDSLYRCEPGNDFYKINLAICYDNWGQLFQAQGKFDTALVFFQKQAMLFGELYQASLNNEELGYGLAVSYERLGDIWLKQGNFDNALVFFQKRSQLGKELYQANPNNENLKNGLAISYEKLGTLYQAQGKFDTALVLFQKYNRFKAQLYQVDPKNESLKNGLAISYSKLGDIYQVQGKFDTALVFFQRYNQFSEELYRDNPKSENFGYGLAISYERLGYIWQLQGNFDSALQFFEKLEQLCANLYAKNPTNEKIKNGLAISYEKLGAIYQSQGKFDTALVFFEKKNQLNEELYLDNPNNEKNKVDLAISYGKLGEIYQVQGKFDTALVFFQKDLKLMEELYRDNPKNVQLWFGLGVSYYKLGALSVELDKTEEAIGYYEQAVEVFRELYAAIGLEQYKANYEYLEGEIERLRR